MRELYFKKWFGFFMEEEKMKTREFFVCAHCGNTEVFKVFTGNFQVVVQSLEKGARIDQSNVLPSLRMEDNFVECQSCRRKTEYEEALFLGEKYIKKHQKLLKDVTVLRNNAHAVAMQL